MDKDCFCCWLGGWRFREERLVESLFGDGLVHIVLTGVFVDETRERVRDIYLI